MFVNKCVSVTSDNDSTILGPSSRNNPVEEDTPSSG